MLTSFRQFHYSNLGSIQQVKAVDRDLLTAALQKRLYQIDNSLNKRGAKSENRLEQEFKEAYQAHLRELKEHRKQHIPDKKLMQFNSTKDPDLYFSFKKSEAKPKQQRKLKTLIPNARKRAKTTKKNTFQPGKCIFPNSGLLSVKSSKSGWKHFVFGHRKQRKN